MSFNVITRLNNLQQQINTIANEGLTNPLEQQLNANSYNLVNLNTLDGNSNILKLESNNVGGIQTNCKMTVDGDLFCDTLHYESLYPPINTQNVTYVTTGQMVENPPDTFTCTNGEGYFKSEIQYYNPSIAMRPVSMNGNGNNAQFGYLTADNLLYGCLWYQQSSRLYVVENGQNGQSIPFNAQDDVDFTFEILNGNMYVSCDGAPQPQLTIPIPSGKYYIYGFCGAGLTDTQAFGRVLVWADQVETLEEVLMSGNDAGGQSITGVDSLTCSQLNYTTLNPPVQGGGENLQQTLAIGNDAGNQNITGVNALTCSTLNYTTLNPPITGGGENLQQTLTNGNNAQGLDIVGVNNLQINYGNCQNIQFFSGNTGVLKQGVNNGNLVISNNNFVSAGTVFDSLYNSPIPKAIKILNNREFTVTNVPQGSAGNGTIFTLPLDTYYTNKINYAQIFFTGITISSGLTPTSLDIYLTNNPNTVFDTNSENYTYQSVDLTTSNNNSFVNTTGLSIVFYSQTYFTTLYLCVNSTFAISTLGVNISGEISVGINIPTITASPT